MRKLFFFAATLCYMLAIQTANAQNPITTLEHAGTTTVFYGQNSLVDAYTASVNGDYLYLSPGYFSAPTAIAKGVKIIGSGHFPDSSSVAKRTYILSGLNINAGADSLRFEGLYINGVISFAGASSINFVKVIRCRLGSVNFNSISVTASKNYCSFEECFIEGQLYFNKYGANLLVSKCVFQAGGCDPGCNRNCTIYAIDGSALIQGNIFFSDGVFEYINSSIIRNNIVIGTSQIFYGCTGNSCQNNLFVSGSVDYGASSGSNNYTGVVQSNIFINQKGNAIDYTHDYHLKSPTTYLGTDGTQVGLYGGKTPFKDKGIPANPQIITKNIGEETDTNGNLQINFKVKAQAN